MKSVGIKLLKDKLSSYINLVKQGEVVLVTDRDEVVAEIRKPLRHNLANISRFESFIEDAAARGALTKPTSSVRFPTTKKEVSTNKELGVDLSQLLDSIRSDRV